MAAVGRYIDKADVERRFGVDNVASWSSLDNDVNGADDLVIQAAIEEGEDWVDDWFRDGRYTIPFVSTGPKFPRMIIRWVVIKAGDVLHGHRGLRDTPERDKINALLDEVRVEINAYLSGQRQLGVQLNGRQPNAPFFV